MERKDLKIYDWNYQKSNESVYDITDKSQNTKIIDRLLPAYINGKMLSNRDLILQTPRFIVIHEVSLLGFDENGNVKGTGKSPETFNMEHYAQKIYNDGLSGSRVGYHYLCGDDSIFQFIPDNEIAHHSGSFINNMSIGIERLICEGVNYMDALHNQAKLVATLMVKYGIPIKNVITHRDTQDYQWSQTLERDSIGRDVFYYDPRDEENKDKMHVLKRCPARYYENWYGGQELFFKDIRLCLENRDLFMELLQDRYTVPKEFAISIPNESSNVRIR